MMSMAKAGKAQRLSARGMACPGGCVAGAGTITPVKESAVNVDRFKKAAPRAQLHQQPLLVNRLKEVEDNPRGRTGNVAGRGSFCINNLRKKCASRH